MPRSVYPSWARWPLTLFVAVLVPIYWREYGPGNFLWFSDITLFGMLVCLWTGNRLIYSMLAVGVLPLELVWAADILTGGTLIGLAKYMFDDDLPLYLRLLSLFHLPLAPLMIWMLVRQGYDRRAWWAQTLLAWIVLPLSFLLTAPAENVNWVHGLGPDVIRIMPPFLYLSTYMIVLPLVVIVPMHLLLRWLFDRERQEGRSK